MEFNRFYMEALKIAFEYAIYKFGDDYLMDLRAKEIQQYLKSAIDGKMKKECMSFQGVSLLNKEIGAKLSVAKNLNCHMIMMCPEADNRLIAVISLFMEPALSFAVLISEDASKYTKSQNSLNDIVEIKTNTSQSE